MLLFNKPMTPLKEKKLHEYEIFFKEPLHDKNAKNSSGYMKSFLIVCKWFTANMESNFIKHCLNNISRDSRNIIPARWQQDHCNSFAIVSFCIFSCINIRGNLKKLTSRKFFGSYYHSLMWHAPLQYRIISFC